MNGNYISSPNKESTTGRPDRDPLATQDDPAKFFDSRHQTRWKLILGLIPGDSDKPLEEVEAAIGVGAFEPRNTAPRPGCNSDEAGLGWEGITMCDLVADQDPGVELVLRLLGREGRLLGDPTAWAVDRCFSQAKLNLHAAVGSKPTMARPTGVERADAITIRIPVEGVEFRREAEGA